MFNPVFAQMAPTTTKLLRSAEALTMPGVQVIVLDANMRCQKCRERVCKILSKMDNLLDYVVDVEHKKVTVKGSVDPKKRMKRLLNHLRERENIELEKLSVQKDLEDIGRKKCNVLSHNIIKEDCCFH